MMLPTARAALGRPAAAATSPYVATRPGGIRRTVAMTRDLKLDVNSQLRNSTTPKTLPTSNFQLPNSALFLGSLDLAVGSHFGVGSWELGVRSVSVSPRLPGARRPSRRSSVHRSFRDPRWRAYTGRARRCPIDRKSVV